MNEIAWDFNWMIDALSVFQRARSSLFGFADFIAYVLS